MFDSIRKRQRLLQGILLLLIFPAFAFFGISGYDKVFSADDAVAKVGDAKVTKQEFEQAQARQLEQIKRVLGDQADPSLLNNEASRKEILDSLVLQKALAAEAVSKNVAVPDQAVRDAILNIDGLKKPDGTFDLERYRTALAAQNKSETSFEAEVRRDLALQQLPSAIAQSTIVSKTAQARMAQLLEEQREVRVLRLKPEDFIGKAQPTPEQLKKHYDDNLKKFEQAEQAKVEYVVLSKDALAASIKAPEDELKKYYEENKAKFSKKEERRASHVLLALDKDIKPDAKTTLKAKADELAKKLKGGADFAAAAKAESKDPGSAANGGDLGFFDQTAMVKPFADAAWALKEGEVSDVVESEFGFHIIKLTGIKGGSQRPYDEVKAEIEREYQGQKAGKAFTESAEGFTNSVYEQADSYAQVVDKYKIKVQVAEKVTRKAGLAQPPNSPLSNAKLLNALFSADSIAKKRNTEAIDIGNNTLVSARIVDYQAAKTPALKDIEASVSSDYAASEARRQAVAAGAEKVKALQATSSDAGFAAEKQMVSRSNPQGLPMGAVEAIFSANVTKLPAYVGYDGGAAGYQVFEIAKLQAPKAEDLKAKEPLYQNQFSQTAAQQTMTDYFEALKSRMKITLSLDKLAPKKDQ